MAASASMTLDRPDTLGDRPIDLVHLARMTFADRALEREVLQLFSGQAGLLLDRMKTAPASAVPSLAHTLKGSARGIGAWRVAAAAEAAETACGRPEGLPTASAALAGAVEEAKIFVNELLDAH